MDIANEVTKVTEEIINDSELYFAYQSNIAMQFVDEFSRCNKKYKNKKDIHKIANQAAKNFLNLWASTANPGTGQRK